MQELLPVGVDEAGLALQELPQRFSTAPPLQLAMAGGLGALNLVAVAYLGRLLAAVAGVPLAARDANCFRTPRSPVCGIIASQLAHRA